MSAISQVFELRLGVSVDRLTPVTLSAAMVVSVSVAAVAVAIVNATAAEGVSIADGH